MPFFPYLQDERMSIKRGRRKGGDKHGWVSRRERNLSLLKRKKKMKEGRRGRNCVTGQSWTTRRQREKQLCRERLTRKKRARPTGKSRSSVCVCVCVCVDAHLCTGTLTRVRQRMRGRRADRQKKERKKEKEQKTERKTARKEKIIRLFTSSTPSLTASQLTHSDPRDSTLLYTLWPPD